VTVRKSESENQRIRDFNSTLTQNPKLNPQNFN
jgi:hypothetical protein